MSNSYEDFDIPEGVTVIDRDALYEKQKAKPPKMYNVFILNDDYSTFELVVVILTQYFGQSESQAGRTAMDVHTKGRGLAGTYTKDIAETKADIVCQYAQSEEMPLRAIAEEAE